MRAKDEKLASLRTELAMTHVLQATGLVNGNVVEAERVLGSPKTDDSTSPPLSGERAG